MSIIIEGWTQGVAAFLTPDGREYFAVKQKVGPRPNNYTVYEYDRNTGAVHHIGGGGAGGSDGDAASVLVRPNGEVILWTGRAPSGGFGSDIDVRRELAGVVAPYSPQVVTGGGDATTGIDAQARQMAQDAQARAIGAENTANGLKKRLEAAEKELASLRKTVAALNVPQGISRAEVEAIAWNKAADRVYGELITPNTGIRSVVEAITWEKGGDRTYAELGERESGISQRVLALVGEPPVPTPDPETPATPNVVADPPVYVPAAPPSTDKPVFLPKVD